MKIKLNSLREIERNLDTKQSDGLMGASASGLMYVSTTGLMWV